MQEHEPLHDISASRPLKDGYHLNAYRTRKNAFRVALVVGAVGVGVAVVLLLVHHDTIRPAQVNILLSEYPMRESWAIRWHNARRNSAATVHDYLFVSIHANLSKSIMRYLLLGSNVPSKPSSTLRMFTSFRFCLALALEHILKIVASSTTEQHKIVSHYIHHGTSVLAVHSIA
jgi:hypothetical protein